MTSIPTDRSKNIGLQENSSSSSDESHMELYDTSKRRRFYYAPTPKGTFRYINLGGLSDSESGSDSDFNTSGMISRVKIKSTPLQNSRLPKVSFNLESNKSNAVSKKTGRHYQKNFSNKEKSLKKNPTNRNPLKTQSAGPLPTIQDVRSEQVKTNADTSQGSSKETPEIDQIQSKISPVVKNKIKKQTKNMAEKQETGNFRKSPEKADRSLYNTGHQTVSSPMKDGGIIDPKEGSAERHKSKGGSVETNVIKSNKLKDEMEKQLPTKEDNSGGRSEALKLNRRKSRKPRKQTNVLKEIRQLQKSTDLLIRRLPFARLVKEIFHDVSNIPDLRIQGLALSALQEAAEIALTTLFENANRCCLHAKRVTLRPEDIRLANELCGFNK